MYVPKMDARLLLVRIDLRLKKITEELENINKTVRDELRLFDEEWCSHTWRKILDRHGGFENFTVKLTTAKEKKLKEAQRKLLLLKQEINYCISKRNSR
ncbi:hypothetical protein HOD96_01985 [Candidatus Falkowbacteria bacterium]|jgi:hypothetical protein|nr:hypothetical protein [Candidatus Falkowbacteria bacterium]MBT4433060.1 hypothetical protein [Candidatus Falkowbacteria bacterium]